MIDPTTHRTMSERSYPGDTSRSGNVSNLQRDNNHGDFAKVFSLQQRNRLNDWCESRSLFTEYQFGFRDGYTTTDCIYLLNGLISNVLHTKKAVFLLLLIFKRHLIL